MSINIIDMSGERDASIKYVKKSKVNFPPEMQYIIQEKAKEIEIQGASTMDHDALTCAIIKDRKMDRKLQALIIARRFLYCCPSSATSSSSSSSR